MNNELKEYLEYLYKKYNTTDYIHTDPIKFPHTYGGNQEFVAFTAAMFAYGNVKAMQKFLDAFFTSCGTNPLNLRYNPDSLKYRFQTASDVAEYCKIIQKIYIDNESIENLFDNGESTPESAAYKAISGIRSYFGEQLTQGLGFLFALPGKSASKRLMMFIRWMIRRDDVDLGLWTHFKPASLSMPLDTHIERFAVKHGIINHSEKGAKALAKVNVFFRELSPLDPVRYDFALTRLGIATGCKYSLSDACNNCDERKKCLFN